MADEVTAAGTIHVDSFRKSNVFQRVMGRGNGATGSVQASLKFDIPGLRDFQKQLTDINTALTKLDQTFAKLAKAPEAFSKQLENAVKQMKALQTAQVQGNRFVTQGTPPSRDPVGQATAAAQSAGGSGGGAGVGGGGGGGKGMGAQIGQAVTQGIQALMKRFDAGMSSAISSDVYASRMAAYAAPGSPSTGSQIFRQQGLKGFGFMATDFAQGNRVQYMGTGIGAYMGAGGQAGQRFGAYATSIKQMQEVMPGLDAEQGAQAQTAIYNNVQGNKLARVMLGPGVSPTKAGGQRKTQNEYFRDVLNALQKLPRPDGSHGAWTREEIMQMNFPGSRLNAWLGAVLPEEVMPMWYEWAINNALSVEKGQGPLSDNPKTAKSQLEKAGRGRSLATNAQETQNREAQKDALFGNEQYGAMNARLDNEKQMLGVLSHIDTMISGIYGIFGRTPSLLQGLVSGGIGGMVGGLLSMIPGLGDPGYMPMGDPEGSTSHLTPDLRKRVNNMMSANPNLKISSAYRDNKRQGDLYASGSGPFAPSGKSKHGRGQAIDFGTQLGWVAKNAKKFGLETAARYVEPWHVQLAGTLNMGDPSSDARAGEAAQNAALISKAMQSMLSSASGAASATTGSTSSSDDLTPKDKGGSLTADQIVTLLHNAGFSGEALVKMAGIANRESGWNPGSYNPDASTGDKSLGLFQINVLGDLAPGRLKLIQQAGGSKLEDLYNPEISAKVAYQMWSQGGFYPWGPYKGVSELDNVKQSALDEARAAATAHGYMGDVGYAPQSSGGGGTNTVQVGGGTTLMFNNTFQLSFPNGASRQSIDVATKQIAQRLEPQIRRLVSRDN